MKRTVNIDIDVYMVFSHILPDAVYSASWLARVEGNTVYIDWLSEDWGDDFETVGSLKASRHNFPSNTLIAQMMLMAG
jgi:hypothetical protein